MGPGRVLPPKPRVQRESGIQVLQRSWTAGRLPGEFKGNQELVSRQERSIFSYEFLRKPRHQLKIFTYSCSFLDVWLQLGHVEPGLHACQHDLQEGAVLSRSWQLWPGNVSPWVILLSEHRLESGAKVALKNKSRPYNTAV